jgi:multidrug efflux pump subunit AcrA (membrane-fusion protein)
VTQPPSAGRDPDAKPREATTLADTARRALAIGLELSKNAARARTLEELQFILVNDTRSLLPFDRSCLIVHFDGKSALAAATNQPQLDRKSDFVQRVNQLAEDVKQIDRALVVFPGRNITEDIPEQATTGLQNFMEYAGCTCLMVVPLSVYDHVVGHLVLEFFDRTVPGEVETYTLVNMVPFLSSALAEKWILAKKGWIRQSFWAAITGPPKGLGFASQRVKIGAGLVVVIVIAALCFPVTLRLGGKAEAVPEYEYFAFAEMDGIVDQVLVKEGDLVKKGQVLATLREQEIDYKIREAQRLRESYQAETEILRNMGAENPAKLAESKLVAIKALRAQQDLDFLNWQRQFLSIRSPVDGAVLTKKVETLVGKKFKAGDPFCKVAPPDVLMVEILVRESDISFVKDGQKGQVFFNYQPNEAENLVVTSISPMSEPMERMGGIFRVRASFAVQPKGIKPGMQGTAHIDAGSASLWFVLTRRIVTRVNEAFLLF